MGDMSAAHVRRLVESLERGWRTRARPDQLAPDGDWTIWLYLAGRKAGKSYAAANFIQEEVESGRAGRIALIGCKRASPFLPRFWRSPFCGLGFGNKPYLQALRELANGIKVIALVLRIGQVWELPTLGIAGNGDAMLASFGGDVVDERDCILQCLFAPAPERLMLRLWVRFFVKLLTLGDMDCALNGGEFSTRKIFINLRQKNLVSILQIWPYLGSDSRPFQFAGRFKGDDVRHNGLQLALTAHRLRQLVH